MADGPIRRKTEKAVRDRAGVPVTLLYDETNDKTIMSRGNASGQQIVNVPTIDSAVDGATTSIKTIDYAHHEVHSGSKYYINGFAELGVSGTLFVKLQTPNTGKWGHFLWEIGSSGILLSTLDEDATGGMAGGTRPTIHSNNRNVGCWTGLHDGLANAATLTDTTKAWTIDALVGYRAQNTTDGSSGPITANTATTVTAILTGGAENDWDIGDKYEINNSQFIITSGVTVATSYIQRVDNNKFGSKGAGGQDSRNDELILKQNTVYLRSFTASTASNIIPFRASWYEHKDN